ncbi:hypothetical protein XELAEV_18037762mg [Xenopus laevis]|uniref:Apolipoprotein C-II n=1 Tax=Xenopus laevis TaxID=8355 RepID=A0A974CCV4_XENLA|nr:hypothetical protein XELAEV_18037762mg [Xenopus laevis]
MQITTPVWCLALLCLLGSQVTAFPSEMQSDDWRASTILQGVLEQYIKPYTGSAINKITDSFLFDVFGRALNGVHGAINLTSEYVTPYYDTYLRARTENTLSWLEKKAEPIREFYQNIYEQIDQ